MFKQYLIALLALLLLGCSQPDRDFNALSATLSSDYPGTIRGTIMHGGQPLSGVSVTSSKGASAISGSDGSFALTDLSSGEHYLTLLKASYIDSTLPEPIMVYLKSENALGTVAMTSRFSTIRGRILDAQGNVISAQQVAGITVDGQPRSTIANSGSYQLDSVEHGTLSIRSVVKGVGFGVITKEIAPDTTYDNVDIQLTGSGGTVIGTVVDPTSGDPINGATVTIIDGVLQSTTDSDGLFKIENVPSTGDITITVTIVIDGDTLQSTIGGISVDEKGSITLDTITIEDIPVEVLAIFAVESGSYRINPSETPSVTLSAPVTLLDEARYSVLSYNWYLSGGEAPDVTTRSDYFLLQQQSDWSEGNSYTVYGSITVASLESGSTITSAKAPMSVTVLKSNHNTTIDKANAPSNTKWQEGVPYNATISASDADSDPITFDLTGPEGVTIGSTSGAVSWPSPTPGVHTLHVTATDGKGAADGYSWQLIVGDAKVAITATTGESALTVPDAAQFTAEVTSTVTPYRAHWLLKAAGESSFTVAAVDTLTAQSGSAAFTAREATSADDDGMIVRLMLENGPDTVSKEWTLTVTDTATSNTAPTDIALSNNAIPANAASDFIVGTVSATDAQGGTMRYEITGGAQAALFAIDGTTLKTATTLDGTLEIAAIEVTVTDDGGLSYKETLTIQLYTGEGSLAFSATALDTAVSGTSVTLSVYLSNIASPLDVIHLAFAGATVTAVTPTDGANSALFSGGEADIMILKQGSLAPDATPVKVAEVTLSVTAPTTVTALESRFISDTKTKSFAYFGAIEVQ